jgi:hypothetical protein
MFQKINDKINASFETDIPIGQEEIVARLKQKAVGEGIFSFLLSGQIDIRDIKFFDNRVEILRNPGAFSAFRPFGKITMMFNSGDQNSTKVRCVVMPGNNLFPLLFIIQAIILLFWSMGWVILGWRLDLSTRYLTPIAVMVISSAILFLKMKRDRRSLIDYSKMVIKVMSE